MNDRESTRYSIGVFLYMPVECLPDDARLSEDLDLDSFEKLNLHMALEEETGLEFELDAAIVTVGQLIEAVEAQMWRNAREVLPFGPQMGVARSESYEATGGRWGVADGEASPNSYKGLSDS
jgi:acyl carrier protein